MEVSQSYRGPEGSIELVGVCRIDETEVECWKPDRSHDQELTERVKTHLVTWPEVSGSFGRKTRYAIFKLNLNPNAVDAGLSSGGSTLVGKGPALSMVRVVSDKADLTGSIRTVLRFRAQPSDQLALKPGAQVEYEGSKVRVLKVARTETDPVTSSSHTRWLIYLAFEGPSIQYATWKVLDRAGTLITAVDVHGKPVAVAEETLKSLETLEAMRTSKPLPAVQRAGVGGVGSSYPDRFELSPWVLVTNVDPKYIQAATLAATTKQILTINDIPMEPR